MPTCKDSPSGQFLLGLRQFNNQQWFQCHETLEAIWVNETGEVRDFYQGIIQIAVALHHWRNGNFSGAVSLLESGVRYLREVPDVCMWVDVSGLIWQSDRMRNALMEAGVDRMSELAPSIIPRLATVPVSY